MIFSQSLNRFQPIDMEKYYAQFYLAYCVNNLSVSGSNGFMLRAISDNLTTQEAVGMETQSKYWCPSNARQTMQPGRRLALFRRPGDAFLVHGLPVVDQRTGLPENSFEHVIAKLPNDFSALDAIRMWRSPAWRTENGGFDKKLPPFGWADAKLGMDFLLPGGSEPPAQEEDQDGAIALRLLNQPDVKPWAVYVLQACLAATSGSVDKFFITGSDDTIARLLFVAFYCLPERLRRRITFSTHENQRSPKDVQIVGITTFDGQDTDLLRMYYTGKYCALNTFKSTKTDSLQISKFAEQAIDWVLKQDYRRLEQIRADFDGFYPADNPSIQHLELLTEYYSLPDEEAAAGTACLLKLCGNEAIGHMKIRSVGQLSSLLELARDSEFRQGLISALRPWLPNHRIAAQEFASVLAQIAAGRLERNEPLSELCSLADFAGEIGADLKNNYWEQIMLLCQSNPELGLLATKLQPTAEERQQSLDNRLGLLEEWQKCHQLSEPAGKDAFGAVAASWLRVEPAELPAVLNSRLMDVLKRKALEIPFTAGNPDYISKVIKQALAPRESQFRIHLVKQLSGWPGDRREVLQNFPAWLVAEVVRLGPLANISFADDIKRHADLASEIRSSFETDFWKELLNIYLSDVPAQGTGSSGPLPDITTRLRLLEKWMAEDKASFQKMTERWLRASPLKQVELIEVLKSTLSIALKMELLELWLLSGIPVDEKTGMAVFEQICQDSKLVREFFIHLPRWQAGGVEALGKIPLACLQKLLASHDTNFIPLADSLNEPVFEALKLWETRFSEILPERLRAILSLGRYLTCPSDFTRDDQFQGILLQKDFWLAEKKKSKEEMGTTHNLQPIPGKTAGGAITSLLTRGGLADFERALNWFGEEKWTETPLVMIRIACSQLTAGQMTCPDPALRRVLSMLDRILEKHPGSALAKSGVSPAKLEPSELSVLARIARYCLPDKDLVESTTGQQVILELHRNPKILEPGPLTPTHLPSPPAKPGLVLAKNNDKKAGNELMNWVDNLRSLSIIHAEVLSAVEFDSDDTITQLSKHYAKIRTKVDEDTLRAWVINALLLPLVKINPPNTRTILSQFTTNVYPVVDKLIWKDFIEKFRRGLIEQEKEAEDGRIAKEFFLWCCDKQTTKIFNAFFVDDWLSPWNAVEPISKDKTYKLLCNDRRCTPKNLEEWKKKFNYKLPWISSFISEVKAQPIPAVVTILIVIGLISFFAMRPPQAQRILSGLLGDYQKAGQAASDPKIDDAKRKDLEEKKAKALEAINNLGTNAISSLVRMAGAKKTAEKAIQGFDILKSVAQPAYGDLTKLLGNKNPDIQACALNCISKIGLKETNAPLHILTLLTNKAQQVREAATNAMVAIIGTNWVASVEAATRADGSQSGSKASNGQPSPQKSGTNNTSTVSQKAAAVLDNTGVTNRAVSTGAAAGAVGSQSGSKATNALPPPQKPGANKTSTASPKAAAGPNKIVGTNHVAP